MAERISQSKASRLITNPIARFNLGLDGNNPDVQTTPPIEDLPISDTLQRELKSPKRIKNNNFIERYVDAQAVNVLRLNWVQHEDNPTKRVLVFLPPYCNSIETGATHYRIQELARRIDQPVLAIDHPGMGNSDPLTEKQIKGLKNKHRNYYQVALAELAIMSKLGITNIDLVGQSMGAWAAVAIAQAAKVEGIKVHNCIVVDSPLEKITSRKLTKREMSESAFLDLYQSQPYDPDMLDASGQNDSFLVKKTKLVKWALSTFKQDPHGVYKKAMANEDLLSELTSALWSNSDLHVTIVNGSLSQVSPSKANLELVKGLEENFPSRVRHIIFPGEPHLVMESARRFANLARLILLQ